MAGTELSIERFEQLLDLHGSGPERWPTAEAEAAHALLARDPRAQRMLGHARRLDEHLAAAMTAPPLPAANLGRVTAGLEKRRRGRDPLGNILRPRVAMAFMAMACVVFSLGAWTGGVVEATSDQITLASVDFTDQAWSVLDQ